eukprot:Clim_evm10s219 gene=Clim_evmTU10s219
MDEFKNNMVPSPQVMKEMKAAIAKDVLCRMHDRDTEDLLLEELKKDKDFFYDLKHSVKHDIIRSLGEEMAAELRTDDALMTPMKENVIHDLKNSLVSELSTEPQFINRLVDRIEEQVYDEIKEGAREQIEADVEECIEDLKFDLQGDMMFSKPHDSI